MMKIPNYKRCALILKLNPFEFGIIVFFLNSCTLVILLQINFASDDELKTIYKGFTKLKTPPSLHGFQFLALDIMIGWAF